MLDNVLTSMLIVLAFVLFFPLWIVLAVWGLNALVVIAIVFVLVACAIADPAAFAIVAGIVLVAWFIGECRVMNYRRKIGLPR